MLDDIIINRPFKLKKKTLKHKAVDFACELKSYMKKPNTKKGIMHDERKMCCKNALNDSEERKVYKVK